MAYAFTLSNMAIKKVTNDDSDEVLNAAVNDLCKGNDKNFSELIIYLFIAAGIFQTLSITYSSTWSVQDGPPETNSESLSALVEYEKK